MLKASQKLKETRQSKGLTLEEVSKATKIKVEFLMSIENGEYNNLPSRTYAHGFVRNYVDFLGLPRKETMALFRREFDYEHTYKVLPEGLAAKDDLLLKPFKLSQGFFFVITILFLFALYIAFQYRFAFINPPLEIIIPKEGAIISSPHLSVVGKTDPNATVFINNTPISIDSDGKFSKNIDLFSEKTTIQIKAVNRFGKETLIDRHVQLTQ